MHLGFSVLGSPEVIPSPTILVLLNVTQTYRNSYVFVQQENVGWLISIGKMYKRFGEFPNF